MEEQRKIAEAISGLSTTLGFALLLLSLAVYSLVTAVRALRSHGSHDLYWVIAKDGQWWLGAYSTLWLFTSLALAQEAVTRMELEESIVVKGPFTWEEIFMVMRPEFLGFSKLGDQERSDFLQDLKFAKRQGTLDLEWKLVEDPLALT